jgi:hypothetical protein
LFSSLRREKRDEYVPSALDHFIVSVTVSRRRDWDFPLGIKTAEILCTWVSLDVEVILLVRTDAPSKVQSLANERVYSIFFFRNIGKSHHGCLSEKPGLFSRKLLREMFERSVIHKPVECTGRSWNRLLDKSGRYLSATSEICIRIIVEQLTSWDSTLVKILAKDLGGYGGRKLSSGSLFLSSIQMSERRIEK